MEVQDGQVAVQPPVASQGATATTEAPVAPPVAASTPAPDPIAEFRKEMAAALELSKREIQSVKDRSVSEIARARQQAMTAENTLKNLASRIKETNPDVAMELETAQVKAENEGYKAQERESQYRQQMADYHQKFVSDLTEELTELGVDPADTRIDRGEGAKNYDELHKRVLKSAIKIAKDGGTKPVAQKDEIAQLKDQIAQLQKQIKQANGELDSVDTSTGGVAGSADKRIYTADEINDMSQDWAANKATILKAQNEGRIRS